MKTFLFLTVGSVAAAGVLPSLPAKIVLSAFVLMAALTLAADRAPVGSEHATGFYLVRARRRTTTARALRRAGRKVLMNWLFPDPRRAAKA
jgi:hypothetical protein